MRKLFLLLAAVVVIALPAVASADTITFTAPATGANQGSGGPNQFNLDHHDAYTWRIDGVNLARSLLFSVMEDVIARRSREGAEWLESITRSASAPDGFASAFANASRRTGRSALAPTPTEVSS